MRALWLVMLTMPALVAPAIAQSIEPAQLAAAEEHRGAIGITPSLAIMNVGLDSNVFNEPTDPKHDFTGTFLPKADITFGVSRLRGVASTSFGGTLFSRYTEQNSFSTLNTFAAEYALHRLRPFVIGDYARIHERPSLEIDTRVRRTEADGTVGATLQLTPKTAFSASTTLSSVAYGDAPSILGFTLQHQLDRGQHVSALMIQQRLSPLTRLLLVARREDTRFPFAPTRNGTATRIMPGVEFKPKALVSGGLNVGVLAYRPAESFVPPFTGLVAAANLKTVIAGDTELIGMVTRDMQYSVDTRAYYVQTGVTATITHYLNRRWNITSTVDREALTYLMGGGPAIIPNPDPITLGDTLTVRFADTLLARPDHVLTAAAGIGVRVNADVRAVIGVGFNQRHAPLPQSRYQNLQTLLTVIYAKH
jgi:putative beta-barrel porin BBP2